MKVFSPGISIARAILFFVLCSSPVLGLDPRKALTQYTRTEWTETDGLPQNTVSVIAQSSDGYLWLGTNEGLVRFDGYEFTSFTRDHGELPSNAISALAAGTDGSLWVGTTHGLVHYQNGRFQTFTRRDGLPGESIAALQMPRGQPGNLWVVSGGQVCRFDGAKCRVLDGAGVSQEALRTITSASDGQVFVAGSKSIYKIEADGAFHRLPPVFPTDFLPTSMRRDRAGNLWVMGTRGLIEVLPDGTTKRFGPAEGLPYSFGLGAMWEDHEGTLWVGSYNGLARFDKGRLTAAPKSGRDEPASVRSIFEDREGSLWVGSTSGLTRLRDDVFTFFGKNEGLPSDQINAVYEDRRGKLWLGFLDGGMASFSNGRITTLPSGQGFPQSRVFAIRETRSGDLLVAAGDGLFRVSPAGNHRYLPPVDAKVERPPQLVYDAMEGAEGQIWLGLPAGLAELRGEQFAIRIPTHNQLSGQGFVTLEKAPDGTIWAGTNNEGVWRVQGERHDLALTADDLGNADVRSIYADRDGAVWVGTFGGGLTLWKDGRRVRFTARDGLPSDNIAKIIDDGDSLWLTTNRGICRIARGELLSFPADHSRRLKLEIYGMADGLRSIEVAPRPGAGGGRHADGTLWFVTSLGIAVYDPRLPRKEEYPLNVAVTGVAVGGQTFANGLPSRIPAGAGGLEIRYGAIHLRSPERVRYSYQLEGVDRDWVEVGNRRVLSYSGLSHGNYTLRLRAALDGVASEPVAYSFEVLPRFYETNWFRAGVLLLVLGLAWLGYKWRERQIHSRFELVLRERTRLAQELHDTMSQAFVGISSQLDGVYLTLPADAGPARDHLDIARRMARHSHTEAQRSIMDLRDAALDDEDLTSALESNARLWTSGSGVDLDVSFDGRGTHVPDGVAHQVLRIAQESITNALKHASATKIQVKLAIQPSTLQLSVSDNGHGFDRDGVFLTAKGHFGLIGMRERAQRLRGTLHINSRPGVGTNVELSVPL